MRFANNQLDHFPIAFCCSSKDIVTAANFDNIWRDEKGDLVRQVHPDQTSFVGSKDTAIILEILWICCKMQVIDYLVFSCQ